MSYVLGTYARSVKDNFISGKGSYLYNDKNEKYLDFVQGIAVNALGHNHQALVKAMKSNSEKPWHLSNLFLSSFIMGAAGFIAGLWADKFDHMATVTSDLSFPIAKEMTNKNNIAVTIGPIIVCPNTVKNLSVSFVYSEYTPTQLIPNLLIPI